MNFDPVVQYPRRELLYTLRGMIRGTQVNDAPADVAACVCPSVSADWTIDAPVDLDELTIAPKRFWRSKQQAFIHVIQTAEPGARRRMPFKWVGGSLP